MKLRIDGGELGLEPLLSIISWKVSKLYGELGS